MPAWVYAATAAWMVLEGLVNVGTVGRPHGPRTSREAVIAAVLFGWVAFLLIAAAIS